jgi:hypothetical protein
MLLGWRPTANGLALSAHADDAVRRPLARRPGASWTTRRTWTLGAPSNDPNPGVLSQSVATIPGQRYDLSFALMDESGLPTDSFVLTFGGFSTTIIGDQAASYTTESFNGPARMLQDLYQRPEVPTRGGFPNRGEP